MSGTEEIIKDADTDKDNKLNLDELKALMSKLEAKIQEAERADQIIKDANTEAGRIVANAIAEADQIVANANAEAGRIVANANAEAERNACSCNKRH